jgi:hypothetical protein
MSGIKIDTGNSGKLIILGSLIAAGLLVLTIGLITFFTGYSYYNTQMSSLNALLAYKADGSGKYTYLTTDQAALAMSQQMSKYLWTKNDVYSFAETLNVYKGSNLTIGQERNNVFNYPDGTSAKLRTMDITFGTIIDLKTFLELYSKIETDKRITSIQPVSVDALKSLKEITITFYLAPDVLPDKTYPLTTSDVYVLSYATPDKGTGKIPIFFASRILYGVFKPFSSTGNPPNIPDSMLSIVIPVVVQGN